VIVDLTVQPEAIGAAKKLGFTLREVQLVKLEDPRLNQPPRPAARRPAARKKK
jgi:hypothetical protein